MLNQIAEPQSSRIHRMGPGPADACLKYVKLECAIHNLLTENETHLTHRHLQNTP